MAEINERVFESMKVKELREYLGKHRQLTSGKKEELVRRAKGTFQLLLQKNTDDLCTGEYATDKHTSGENGEVTLPSDDRRAEVLFQTSFASTPQVQFSIKGFDFDLDSRPQPPPSYRYGYFVQYREPNAIGVTTNAIASKTGVTFEAVDVSFGDTRLRSVTIAYQACNIGPGTELSGAHGIATPATTTV